MLNLPDFEPQVPFLLGSLVGEVQGGVDAYQEELSLTQETELELGGLDMPVSEDMDGTVEMGGMRETIDVGSSEGLKLSEIELDNLETMEVTDASDTAYAGTDEIELGDLSESSPTMRDLAEEGEEMRGLEFEMDESLSVDLPTLDENLTAAPADAATGDSLELNLDEHDLSELAKELENHLEAEDGGKKRVSADDPESDLDKMTIEMEED
jgi:hypothetical protein